MIPRAGKIVISVWSCRAAVSRYAEAGMGYFTEYIEKRKEQA